MCGRLEERRPLVCLDAGLVRVPIDRTTREVYVCGVAAGVAAGPSLILRTTLTLARSKPNL